MEIGSVSKQCMESRSMSHQKPACVKTEKLLRETHTKERSRCHKPEALKQPQDEGGSDSETVLVPVAQLYPYPPSWMAEYPGERKCMDCSLTSVKHKGNGLLGCLYQSVMGRGWSSLLYTDSHILIYTLVPRRAPAALTTQRPPALEVCPLGGSRDHGVHSEMPCLPHTDSSRQGLRAHAPWNSSTTECELILEHKGNTLGDPQKHEVGRKVVKNKERLSCF